MARIVKCQQCKIANTTSDVMVKDKKGYFHPECYDIYITEQEAKLKELEELDMLVETIKDIHNFTVIDKRFFAFIQDTRNGTIRFQGKPIKKHKEGVSYSVINDAYLLAVDSIKWAKLNKKFENDLQELKYGLAIATSKINDVIARQKQIEQQKVIEKRVESNVIHSETEVKATNKRRDELDISDFL